ncbi:oxygen-independent coproporphyrinogen III oxidase [Usitatibacter palustris]|uniref:Coproporphyrinogen-III oxidase n=1 Tax=Usitatibacter palustris TaxID=2732487 RepID=A0A6M4H3R5_9PROT|nr:oxygen-independent coproporphyrinogen III oxidase [Usitatibacter palustris]QJR14241.1 Oxygen-independent coproporphyrinogen III oxidase [Usitatibacter palustris]
MSAAPSISTVPDAFQEGAVVVDPDLIRKHGGNGPRYTSYPTADRFVEAFDDVAYRHWLANRNVGGFSRPLGLYVHVPFCDTLCFYCACNKIITKDRARAAKYVDYLEREIRLVAGVTGKARISSMHWGGGTPTFLGRELTERLVGTLRDAFDFDPAGEWAIEVDPRRVEATGIAHLGQVGFNRISMGVQDFDPQVQQAVHRIQSVAQTREAIDAARRNGFTSVNLDLIYGLPKQTVAGFMRTLDRVIECDPDRVALYSYAHLPAMFMPQRRILEADLPSPEVKLELLTTAIRRLGEAGYRYIGMDHFAKPNDPLAVAQRQGRLTRDFQGYSCGGDSDVVGLGVSAIGKVGPAYAQNVKGLEEYYSALDAGRFPTLRGIQLSPDDLVRRAAIQALACHFSLAKESLEIAYLIEFDTYFAREMESLRELEADGLVELEDGWIHVTPAGRLLVRVVCAVFDRYLRETQQRTRYSRVV